MNYLIIITDSQSRGSWGRGKTILEAAQQAEIDLYDDCEYDNPDSYVIYRCQHEEFWCNPNGSIGWSGDKPKKIREGLC